jgi:hypothetical protein
MPDQQFELELDRDAAHFFAEAQHFAPQIAEQVLSSLLDNGPYWSGRSKASWVASLESPVTTEAADVPKRPGGIAEGEARERAMATLANLLTFQVGQTIYLTQGTNYLELINSGAHPGSQNVGFIEAALAQFEGLIDLQVTY